MNRAVLIGIPVLMLGGTELQTLTLVKALIDANYRVSVCCYYNYDEVMTEELRKSGAELILMKLERKAGLLHLLKKLFSLFSKLQPAIVHVQYIAPGLIPILAARLAGVPCVFATVHQPGRTYSLKARIMLRVAARLCRQFFCNSISVEKSWFGEAALFNTKNSHPHHCTIYNAVDAKKISSVVAFTDREALLDSLNIDSNRPIIGVVGRLRAEKGQTVLLKAMPLVLRKFPSALLLVIGDGIDRENLRELSKELAIADNIRWLGQQGRVDVYRLYTVMTLLVVPSLFEGFGLTAAEGMAARLPVVGSDADGLAEVILNNETGMLVPSGDADALAAAIIHILSESEAAISMGLKGEQYMIEHFSLQRFSENITAAYRAFQNSRY